MGRECNSIHREKSGLERLPIELAQSVEEIEAPEIASPHSKAYQLSHARLRKRQPNQRNLIINDNVEKNEILSRTSRPFYLVLALLLLSQGMGVSAGPLRPKTSVVDSRQRPDERPNKNCKEFDVTSRAYLADLIFEGTARSRSAPHGSSGRYEVTFVVHSILKQRNNTAVRLYPKSQVRLQFTEHRKKRSRQHCTISSVTSTRLVKSNVKTGGTYLVFAHRLSPMNYSARGEPIVSNRRNRKSIMSVISRSKEKPPRVLGLQNVSQGVSSPLRLSCQVRGLPVPRITWFKDGTSLIPPSHMNITYHRKNSTIEIPSARLEDGGRYTCRATSVTGVSAAVTAYVNITSSSYSERTSPTTVDSDWPLMAEKCQVDAFCLNNGKCRFIASIGEHMCICAEGFTGARCGEKDVSRDWFPSGLEEGLALPALKRLYRSRRIRGHAPLSKAEYKAVIQSIGPGGKKKFRHWLSSQRMITDSLESATPELPQI